MDGLILLSCLVLAQPPAAVNQWIDLMAHNPSGDLLHWRPSIEAPRQSRLTQSQCVAERRALLQAMRDGWRLKNGILEHSGDGCDIETNDSYGDYRLELDWRVESNSEIALFLRGTPGIKLWDPRSRYDLDRGLGSAGLYFNREFRSAPLIFSDAKVGAWNFLQVVHLGDRVTVHLNGLAVVDSVPLEQFWKNNVPNPLVGPLVLKAHKGVVALKGIRIQQLSLPVRNTPERAH